MRRVLILSLLHSLGQVQRSALPRMASWCDAGADLGEGCRGCAAPPPPPPRDDLRFSNTTGILQKKKRTMWFVGVEVEQETSAPPPKKNPGSAPATVLTKTNLQKN